MKKPFPDPTPIAYGGKIHHVLEDDALLQWAAEHSLRPSEAQIQALKRGIVPHRYLKNFEAISLEEQIRICTSRVFVAGCGGLGGVVISLLARLGVGHLRIIDGDAFAASNLNRQWFSTVPDLGRPKAQVAGEVVSRINPLVRVEAVAEMLTEDSVDGLLEGMHLALDALDNLPARYVVADGARKAGIPFIHAAVSGWWGQVSTFLPEFAHGVRNIYGGKTSRDPVEDAMGVLGPTASLTGNLQVFEAMRLILGKPPAYTHRLAYFDGETGTLEHIPLNGGTLT